MRALKIGFIIVSTLFLIAVLSIPFASAQPWSIIRLRATHTNLVLDEINGSFSFTVSPPEFGSPNNIMFTPLAVNAFVKDLSPGDTVVVNYAGFADSDWIEYGEADYTFYNYGGPADSVTVNGIAVTTPIPTTAPTTAPSPSPSEIPISSTFAFPAEATYAVVAIVVVVVIAVIALVLKKRAK